MTTTSSIPITGIKILRGIRSALPLRQLYHNRYGGLMDTAKHVDFKPKMELIIDGHFN